MLLKNLLLLGFALALESQERVEASQAQLVQVSEHLIRTIRKAQPSFDHCAQPALCTAGTGYTAAFLLKSRQTSCVIVWHCLCPRYWLPGWAPSCWGCCWTWRAAWPSCRSVHMYTRSSRSTLYTGSAGCVLQPTCLEMYYSCWDTADISGWGHCEAGVSTVMSRSTGSHIS